MKCPKCGEVTRVLATRVLATRNEIKRRRECTRGHRFSTEELPTVEIHDLRKWRFRWERLRLLVAEK